MVICLKSFNDIFHKYKLTTNIILHFTLPERIFTLIGINDLNIYSSCFKIKYESTKIKIYNKMKINSISNSYISYIFSTLTIYMKRLPINIIFFSNYNRRIQTIIMIIEILIIYKFILKYNMRIY